MYIFILEDIPEIYCHFAKFGVLAVVFVLYVNIDKRFDVRDIICFFIFFSFFKRNVEEYFLLCATILID